LDRVLLNLSQWNSATRTKRVACLLDTTEKLWMRQPKLEPVFFGKPDEDAGGTTVPRNDNLFFDREAKLLGEVILHLRQSHFLRFLGLASLAPRAMPGPRLS
jgi:hypothetical protein